MKVKELFCKMVDSYVEIAVNEYKGVEHTGRRWILEPHAIDYTCIPKEIWDKEVIMIVPYRRSIEIDVDSSNENTLVNRPVWKITK